MTETIHCPKCGSIYVMDFEMGDFTITKDGLVQCHVCHFEIGRFAINGKVRTHTEPFTDCAFCKELDR